MDLEREFSEKAKADLILVEKARTKNDERAYAELMYRYRRSVYFMVYKMVNNDDDAEDLTIEIFAKAFININKYTPDFAFSTWLFRIASNHTIDFIRKRRLKTTSIDDPIKSAHGDDMEIQIQDFSLNPHDTAVRKQMIELVRLLVNNLPEKYKELVMLRYFRELAYEEIAEEMNMPLGTVKAQLFRAREMLFKIMKDKRGSI